MKNKLFFKISISVLVLVLLTYQFGGAVSSRILPLWEVIKIQIFRQAPCEEPIPYVLGSFDTKFNISEKYFLSAVADAEAIWEEPFEKDLFTYTPNSSSSYDLKINLIYDYRQQATSKLGSLGIVVEDNRASYDALKSKLNLLKSEYEKEKIIFNARVASFNKAKDEYEEQVKYWNKRSGASEEEFNKLEDMRRDLIRDSKELENIQAGLNAKVEEINALVVAVNRLASKLNLAVENYNTVNEARGESFEEGVYYSQGLNRSIDIYEFSNREKLVRVLAHELGHALGLSHVDDPKAIMYEFNEDNNETLTASDLAALKVECGIK